MRIESVAGVWTVTWRWFSPVFVALAVFCCFWDGILVVWYATAVSAHFGHGMGPFALILPVLHVMIGLGLTYVALCGFANRTTISLDREALRVRHGPLPWRGATVPRVEIRQLFCREVVRKGEHSTTTHYRLMALRTDGAELSLLRNIDDASEVRFLEQQLERELHIVDEAVAGELR